MGNCCSVNMARGQETAHRRELYRHATHSRRRPQTCLVPLRPEGVGLARNTETTAALESVSHTLRGSHTVAIPTVLVDTTSGTDAPHVSQPAVEAFNSAGATYDIVITPASPRMDMASLMPPALPGAVEPDGCAHVVAIPRLTVPSAYSTFRDVLRERGFSKPLYVASGSFGTVYRVMGLRARWR